METLVGIVIFGVILFAFLSLIPGGKTIKPDPDEKEQEKLAKEMLKGNTTPEEIAEENGYDIEHIKKWKDDYTQLCIKFALEADKFSSRIDLMEDDIEWFKKICREHIGEDWEAKTGFNERFVTKHKD